MLNHGGKFEGFPGKTRNTLAPCDALAYMQKQGRIGGTSSPRTTARLKDVITSISLTHLYPMRLRRLTTVAQKGKIRRRVYSLGIETDRRDIHTEGAATAPPTVGGGECGRGGKILSDTRKSKLSAIHIIIEAKRGGAHLLFALYINSNSANDNASVSRRRGTFPTLD